MKRALLALLPVFFIASFWFFISSNRDAFPDPVAIHWNLVGEPDGFGSLDTQLWISIFTLSVIAALWIALIFLGKIPLSIRILFMAITGAIWLVLYGIFNYTLLIQLGLENASEARIGIVFFVVMISIPLALVPWLLAKPKIDLGERLSVRYWQIPLFSTSYQEIEFAGQAHVKAMEFGGLGVRYANKTTAFLPSSGAALELRLKAGERILIRTDFAEEVLEELARKRNGN